MPSPLDSAEPFYYQPKRARILLVESDVEIADELLSLLEADGHAVEIATDGQYALMLAADFRADLVILDTDLVGTGSSDVAQVLKGAPHLSAHYRNVPILYLASPELLINQRFHRHPTTPMSDYLFKPVNAPLVLERVRRALQETRPATS